MPKEVLSPFFSGELHEGWTVLMLSPGVYSFFRSEVQDGAEHSYMLPLPVHVFRSFSATIRASDGSVGTPADFVCALHRGITGSNQWTLLSCDVYDHERNFTRSFTEGSLATSAGRYIAYVTGKADEILYLEFIADFNLGAAGGGNLHTLQDGREAGLYAISDAWQDVWQESAYGDNVNVAVTRLGEAGKHHYVLGYTGWYSDHRLASSCELKDDGITIALLLADGVYHCASPGIIISEGSDLALTLPLSGDPVVRGYLLLVGVTR